MVLSDQFKSLARSTLYLFYQSQERKTAMGSYLPRLPEKESAAFCAGCETLWLRMHGTRETASVLSSEPQSLKFSNLCAAVLFHFSTKGIVYKKDTMIPPLDVLKAHLPKLRNIQRFGLKQDRVTAAMKEIQMFVQKSSDHHLPLSTTPPVTTAAPRTTSARLQTTMVKLGIGFSANKRQKLGDRR